MQGWPNPVRPYRPRPQGETIASALALHTRPLRQGQQRRSRTPSGGAFAVLIINDQELTSKPNGDERERLAPCSGVHARVHAQGYRFPDIAVCVAVHVSLSISFHSSFIFMQCTRYTTVTLGSLASAASLVAVVLVGGSCYLGSACLWKGPLMELTGFSVTRHSLAPELLI